MIPVQIIGASGLPADVLPGGRLVISAIAFSEAQFQEMNVVDTAFNFYSPKVGKRLVITGFIVETNKDIGPDGASVVFYEADSADTLTVDKTVLQFAMTKNTNRDPLPLHLVITAGKFLNGKTNDATVLATVLGYEVKV